MIKILVVRDNSSGAIFKDSAKGQFPQFFARTYAHNFAVSMD